MLKLILPVFSKLTVFRSRKFWWHSIIMAALVSCASPSIDLKDSGKISGNLMIFWVGEDRFVYYPYNGDPLTYHLPEKLRQDLSVSTIRPGLHYTDGGSIPPLVRGLAGLSPWGYGPAYIVHDWLFAAHHCLFTGQPGALDPRDEDEAKTVSRVTFKQSADLLAGVISALIKQNVVPKREAAPSAIYTAVDSVVAKNLWDKTDPKSCDPVTKEDLDRIRRSTEKGIASVQVLRPGAVPPLLVFQQRF
ncbi:hypothetical protein [Mesorhizobium sp.]|uniref:hypothetical protein n=1 Tax=Mesorhizobium sp. TaxID=1871066 RepID=UPI0011F86E47|nr:hypothetical protein [Mesorhizobium sp.]TIO09591.1 MAG: hypothetical protein E5X88_06785 [Mesorhizobium sp.]TIO34081.1 MAG: hypothetical protein E5X89_12250 [Mesorhizobium sp.]TIP11777.1 MAG: hypothetical protein E5X73_14350 [Mesorhizobium sp.]